MCLVTNWRFPRITLKDKIVYKVLSKQEDGILISPFMNVKYELNKLYKEPINQLFGVKGKVCKAIGPYWLHSEKYLNSAKMLVRSMEVYETSYSLHIFKAIIPKFTLYYEGLGGICSKKLKVIEECV